MALTEITSGRNFRRLTADAVDATGTNSSDNFPASEFLQGDFQFVWAAMTGTATAELQRSLDGGTSFDTIANSEFTTSGASGSTGIVKDPLEGGVIRMTVTSASAAGTITVFFEGMKGR